MCNKLKNSWSKKIDPSVEAILERSIGKWIDKPDQKYALELEYFDGTKSDTFFDKYLDEEEIIEIIPNLSYLKEFEKHFETRKDQIETEYLLPIIADASGVIFIATSGMFSGQIFHVDGGDFGFAHVANNVEDFNAQLTEFDF